MAKTKVAVRVDSAVPTEVDVLVRDGRFPNRSQAIESAVEAQLERLRRTRLAEACRALDQAEERAFAEEGLSAGVAEWSEY
ncbi:MAG TPA: hypothetical protein VJL28_05410 [Gemmatimonadaceae bacterium]|nr:hypothetical protein [Gemmatimonadaceae bacterium]